MIIRGTTSALFAAIVVTACASQGPSTRSIVLQNANFEAPTRPGERCAVSWDCTMHAGASAFRFFRDDGGGAGGAHGYCIESVEREPWGKVSQALRKEQAVPLRGARLRLSVAMKLDSVTGGQAGPMIIAYDGSGQILRSAVNLQERKPGWQRFDTEMEIPPETFLLEVGATFQGKGKVCVGDVRLEMAAAAGPV